MTVAGDDRRACEITRELGQRIVDVAGMLVRVHGEAASDVADAFGPSPQDIYTGSSASLASPGQRLSSPPNQEHPQIPRL